MGRKHLSVLMLYVRGCIYPVLTVLLLLVAVQTGLFCWLIQRGAGSLDAIMQNRGWWITWMVGIVLVIVLLFRMHGGNYTVRRLRISERAAFLWQSLSCLFCYVLLWLTEVILFTVLCRYYLKLPAAAGASEQTLFLTFYHNAFLHSMLPLEELSRWVYLLTAFVALSMGTANAVVRMRYGSKPFPLLLAVISFQWYFSRPLGSLTSDVLVSLLHLAIIVYTLWDAWFNMEEVPSDENN